jgi:hypothetical protein
MRASLVKSLTHVDTNDATATIPHRVHVFKVRAISFVFSLGPTWKKFEWNMSMDWKPISAMHIQVIRSPTVIFLFSNA